MGHPVFTANSGEKALEIYRQQGSEIDVVVLDLGMPGMGGKACFKELLKINPCVKVIIATGYGHGWVESQMVGAGPVKFLSKPYRIAELLDRVREIMQEDVVA